MVIRKHLINFTSDFTWVTDGSDKNIEPRDHSIGISSNVLVYHVNYEGNKETLS